jgi:hypothetical protein
MEVAVFNVAGERRAGKAGQGMLRYFKHASTYVGVGAAKVRQMLVCVFRGVPLELGAKAVQSSAE